MSRCFQADRIVWSDELYELYGLPPGEGPLTLERLMELVHPDYHDYHQRQVETLTRNGKAEFEYPIRRPDGAVRWVWARGKRRDDADGTPTHLFGIAQDITSRKQAEEALREKSSQLENLLHIAPALYYSFDPAVGGIEFAPQVERVLGYSVDHLKSFPCSGMTPSTLRTLRSRRILFAVSDTGMGIPESMLDEVFETFSQGRDQASPYSRDIEGSGLGLPLVKRLVRLMGGSLCISSQEQQGTTVYVSLPFQLLEAPGSGLCAEAVRESAATLTGYRVLVADDDPMSRKAAQMLLENQGCRVQLAQNGQAALQRLEEEQFDLVLMDVKMPVMDGMEATRRIRSSRPGLRSLPVIGMTAYAMSGDREHFLAAGMDDYIAKPIEKEMLLATISRHVSGA